MSWKSRYRSLYYRRAPEPDDLKWELKETALLVIDVQITYLERLARDSLSPAAREDYDLWTPFHDRMQRTVVPNTSKLLEQCRSKGIECLFARIACHTKDGRDRSLSQKMPGWNNLLLQKDGMPS